MKIKNLFAAIIVMIAMTVVSSAQEGVHGTVESQNLVEKGKVTPTLDVYVHGNIKGKLGWSVFTLNTPGWGEALVGPTYAPTNWLELSASIGVEKDAKPLRGAASVWVGKGKWSALSIHEFGGSGYWTKNIGKYQVTKKLAIGVHGQRFVGVGPYTEFTIGKHFSIWSSYPMGSGKRNSFLSLKYNF